MSLMMMIMMIPPAAAADDHDVGDDVVDDDDHEDDDDLDDVVVDDDDDDDFCLSVTVCQSACPPNCVSVLSASVIVTQSAVIDLQFYVNQFFFVIKVSLQSNIYDKDFYFKKSQVCLVQFNVTQAPSMARLLEAVSSLEGPLYVLTVRIQKESVC
ncbi:unnamed protein product [Porites evermanni]|uniref:Uncharacterized protein n=1 Tax=Porites evermanni TaxID=104178 RepID=A0ABN8MS54_9CNID|nr:unnamed protein product [Porites evermanni]